MKRCRFFILALLVAALMNSGGARSLAAEVFGKNSRPPAMTEHKPKVNRYRTTAKPVEVDCECNPGIYSVVYLTPDDPTGMQFHPDTSSMAQKDTRFEPSVLVVAIGSSVEFPNLDPFFHNVFSYSKTKKFDLGRYPQGNTSVVTFDKPGLVKVFCEIHSSMRAYVHVLETSYFAVSDKDGNFHIPDVPSGRYTLHLWQEDQPDYAEPISIVADSVFLAVEP
jgi:plastocyanin